MLLRSGLSKGFANASLLKQNEIGNLASPYVNDRSLHFIFMQASRHSPCLGCSTAPSSVHAAPSQCLGRSLTSSFSIFVKSPALVGFLLVLFFILASVLIFRASRILFVCEVLTTLALWYVSGPTSPLKQCASSLWSAAVPFELFY
jgi:hypothetical protein